MNQNNIIEKNRMKTIIYIVLLFLNSSNYSQIIHQDEITNQKSNLKEIVTKLNEVIKDEMKPGLLLCIVSKDSVMFDSGLGYADIDSKLMVDKHTQFRLGSITKTFTSMAILYLVSEGKIKLTDELKRIAPEIPIKNSWESTNPLRIIHLLEHTAGFDDLHFKAIYNSTDEDLSVLDAVKYNSNSLVSRWQPGERFSYSNPGYAILGYVIEKYSGKAWHEYIKEKILVPLEMNNTNFDLRITREEKYAKGYKHIDNKNIEIPFYANLDGASGSLNSCAADMAKFIQFFLNDWKINGKPWLPVSVLNDMEIPHSNLAAQNGLLNGYGLGNSSTAYDAKVIFHGHNGSFPGFTSKFAYNRKLGVGYAICNNNETDNSKIIKIITDYLTQDISGSNSNSIIIDTNNIKPYLGHYQFLSPRYELLDIFESLFSGYSFILSGDRLLEMDVFGGMDTLVQVSANKFRKNSFNSATYLFTTNKQGEKILMRDGAFYKKINIFWLRLQQVLFVLSILSVFVGFLFYLWKIIIACLKKQHRQQFKYFIIPFISSLSLLSIIYPVMHFMENILDTSTMNIYTLILYIGTLLFGVLSVVNIILIFKYWRNQNNTSLKYFLLINGLLSFYLAVLLFQNDWIGIQTWNY